MMVWGEEQVGSDLESWLWDMLYLWMAIGYALSMLYPGRLISKKAVAGL